jgi:hypothetical protein
MSLILTPCLVWWHNAATEQSVSLRSPDLRAELADLVEVDRDRDRDLGQFGAFLI